MKNFLIKPASLGTGPAEDCIVMLDTTLPATSPTLAEKTDYEAFELGEAFTFQTGIEIIAPVAFSLSDLVVTQGTGPFFVDLTLGFSGGDLSYETDQDWATIDGTILIIEDVARVNDVTITATNSKGSARLDLSVTIAPALIRPQPFSDADWSLKNLGTGTSVELIINALPVDDGPALTDIEYRIDGTPWVSLGSVATTTYAVSGLTEDEEAAFEVRAVNSNEVSIPSDVKEIVLTAILPFTISQGASDADIVLNGVDGEVEIEITAPTRLAGTYAFSTSETEAGPIILTHNIIGDKDVGAIQEIVDSIVVSAAQNAPATITETDWRVAGVSQATTQTYSLSEGDMTLGLEIAVTAADSASSTTQAFSVVGPTVLPIYSSAPKFNGIFEVGETVTLSASDVEADEVEYRFLVDSEIVSNVSVYVIQPSDAGKLLTGETRARNRNGDWTIWQTATGEAIASATGNNSYVENGIVFDGASYLVQAGPFGAESKTLFGMVSFIPNTNDGHDLLGVDGANSFISTGAGLRLRWNRFPSNNFSSVDSQGYAVGDRIHALFSIAPDDIGNPVYQVTFWDEAGQAWQNFTVTDNDTYADLGFTATSLWTLGARTNGARNFNGTLFRLAVWTGQDVPDITDNAVRETLIVGDNSAIADPAISTAAYGTPIVDVYGTASEANALTINKGSLGAFTSKTGTFTDA